MTAGLARRHAVEPDARDLNGEKDAEAGPRPSGMVIEGRFGRPPLPPQPSPYSDRDAAVAELANWLGAHA